MRIILNIETATRNCSVAVSKNGECVSLVEAAEEGYSHAEKLHRYITEAMHQANVSFADLSAVAVSKGPGSYTGLRIGVSAAKGLCFALELPLIAVDTLAVLASQVSAVQGVIIPMLDARRMEVYSAMYDRSGNKIKEVAAEILTAESYAGFQETIHIAGDCQQKIREVLTGPNFIFHDDATHPSAREMAPLADAIFQSGTFENLAYFEPFYLKDFIAGVK